MSCGCSNFDGREALRSDNSFEPWDSFEGRDALSSPNSFEPWDSADGFDEDFEEEEFDMADGEDMGYGDIAEDIEEGSEEFDDFLTRRSRARRKLRKKYRKEGKSRKEARKLAVSKIPKQKLGSLLKNAILFKTDPETKKLIDQGLIPKEPSVATQLIKEAVQENEQEGTQTQGSGDTPVGADTGGTTTPIGTPPVKKAGMGKGVMMVLIAGVVIGGGWWAWKKFGK